MGTADLRAACETWAHLALDAAIVERMPVAAWHAVHGQLSHVQTSAMRYHLGISSEMSNPMGTRTADRRTARPPAVAGQFYPADPDRLRAEVSMLLAAAPRGGPERPPEGDYRSPRRLPLFRPDSRCGVRHLGRTAQKASSMSS